MLWGPGGAGHSLPGWQTCRLCPLGSRVLTWVDSVGAPGSVGGRSHRGQRRQQQQQEEQKPGLRAGRSHGQRRQRRTRATPGPAAGLSLAWVPDSRRRRFWEEGQASARRGGAALGTPPWKQGVTRGRRKPEMQTARQGKDCPAGAGRGWGAAGGPVPGAARVPGRGSDLLRRVRGTRGRVLTTALTRRRTGRRGLGRGARRALTPPPHPREARCRTSPRAGVQQSPPNPPAPARGHAPGLQKGPRGQSAPLKTTRTKS